ncbi:hypothetical protein GCM10010177_82390 [Actinomadura citrea]|nr:hypothetical protein GCM10010177_82390 [Actinomadura citrea]
MLGIAGPRPGARPTVETRDLTGAECAVVMVDVGPELVSEIDPADVEQLARWPSARVGAAK